MQYQSINPATVSRGTKFAHITDQALEAALQQAASAFEVWRETDVSVRSAMLRAIAASLREDAGRLASIIVSEMGKRVQEAYFEIQLCAQICDYYADHVGQFLAPEQVPGVEGALILKEPIGPILAIEPWNFPFYQIFRVAAPQLAAGNMVIVKPSELVPECAVEIAALFQNHCDLKGVYTNIFASHDQIGEMIADPRIKGVTFTGSTQAGAVIAEQAGRNLKKVVLELGGSDPMIVREDAPIEWAVQQALFGRLLNTGQCCVGTKRLIVVGKERAEIVEAALARIFAKIPAGDPGNPETKLGPLVSGRAVQTLKDQVDRAVAHGARLVAGGSRMDRAGFYFEPTILADMAPDNPVYREEFFGPVLMLDAVADDEEAVSLANATPFGLGASILSEDLEVAERMARRIASGMVFINQASRTQADLPFGGIGQSGFGRELAEAGFGEFLNRKLVTAAPCGTPPLGA
ncbi:aldehyde dehydrogenase family protein [Erythrobacter sp. YJ-T3-07]|uniref:aldehyde dehydrogenase family protein n=1 Tax=Erythrobacter sp. YJ-T3-07 TaxID=2793063 RepID=UPI0018D429F5|nr:aldehyde dehydrogenase family protein [Erythrobacter sp. YJ-T3-07]MBH1945341.1 aldehyde dehydrogenase family protein [Erythrobacter sp. YJ-T3-07]